ncbi:Uncharacterized protein TrispH2_011414 [Trichoplax sp. H2]|nr:Uncharacterized protein TrispH2_011414 [Trichoplax sp. H2]|eukprot:RDD37009.1 Uncharacterized protein TrispH2_011414 [Trichoplax sp. H2]
MASFQRPHNRNETEMYQERYDNEIDKKCTMAGYLSEMKVTGNGFKNLNQSFCWSNIPMLAVITGKNGCGKTAVLEAIMRGLREEEARRLTEGSKELKIEHKKSIKHNGRTDKDIAIKCSDEIPKCHYYSSNFRKNEDLGQFRYFNKDNSFDINFGSWNSLVRNLLRKGIKIDHINDHLKKSGFKHDVSKDKKDRKAQCVKRDFYYDKSDVQISPGESLELLSALWLFEIETDTKSNKRAVYLLDEPDAHLHTSSVKRVIEIIKTRLVLQLGMQVIMTTHSSTTVSLVPKDCIYIMREDTSRTLTSMHLYEPLSKHNTCAVPKTDTRKVKIEQAESRRQALQYLDSGCVYVNSPFRMVFVEAYDDKLFYQMIQLKLTNESMLEATYPLLFMSPGVKRKRQDSSDDSSSKMIENSCRALVENIVETCMNIENEDLSLREFVFGLIDNDNKEEPKLYNIRCLNRYSMENYLYDPVYIYYYLRKCGKAEEIKTQINVNLQEKQHPDCLSDLLMEKNVTNLTKVLQQIVNIMSKNLFDIVEKFIKLKDDFQEAINSLKTLHKDVVSKSGILNKESIITIDNFETVCKFVYNEGKLIDYVKKIRQRTNCKGLLKELIDYTTEIVEATNRLIKKKNLIKKQKGSEEAYELIKCTEDVRFENNITLSYPKVILKMRGHDLVTFYTAIFPSLPSQNSKMINFLKRSRFLIPLDLIDIFKSFQRPDIELQRQNVKGQEKDKIEQRKGSQSQQRQFKELQDKNDSLRKSNESLEKKMEILTQCLNKIEQEMESEECIDLRENLLRHISEAREKVEK